MKKTIYTKRVRVSIFMIKPLFYQQSVLFYWAQRTNCSGMFDISEHKMYSLTTHFARVTVLRSHFRIKTHTLLLSVFCRNVLYDIFPIYVSFEAMYNYITKV